MAGSNPQARAAWALARQQHWLLTYDQLRRLSYSRHAIAHRVASGRLHRVRPRVFAVGRRPSDRQAEWMAALLSVGPQAGLSDDSAAAPWRIRDERTRDIHVTLPPDIDRRQPGIIVHRRAALSQHDLTHRDGIRVTSPIRTLIDLATHISSAELESAVNAADKLDLVDPETLRVALDERRGQPGVGILRRLLDRRTFALTDSELERRFLPILRRARLPPPLTQQWVNGFRVDFYWPRAERCEPGRGMHLTAQSATLAWDLGPAPGGLRSQMDGGRSDSGPRRYDWRWTVLSGVLAVPCTRNPLKRG